MVTLRSRSHLFVALATLISVLLAIANAASAQTGSATGTFDTSNAAVGITQVLENRITITRNGNSAQAEVVVTVITELPGNVVGSVCGTQYTQSMAASATITPGQKAWGFSGTLITDWQLLSNNPADCLGGPTHNELPHSFSAQISGTSMSGFVNGMAFTILDASAILDQPTASATPVPTTAATPSPTEDEFADGEELELLEKECFENPGLRPVIGVVTAVSGTVEVQRDVSGTYLPVHEGGEADAPADPSLVAADSFVLRQGDVLRTGEDAAAKVLIFEKPIPVADLASKEGTALNELGGNVTEIDQLGGSILCVRTGLTGVPGLPEKTVLDLIKGVLRHHTKDWKNGSVFSTRAGTTIIGIRGTEFVLARWDEEDETAVLLFEGEIAVEAPEPGIVLQEGSWTLIGAGAPELWALSEDDWQTVLEADDTLAAIRALDRTPLADSDGTTLPEAQVTTEEDEGGGGSGALVIAAVAVIVLAMVGGVGGWFYMRRRSSA